MKKLLLFSCLIITILTHTSEPDSECRQSAVQFGIRKTRGLPPKRNRSNSPKRFVQPCKFTPLPIPTESPLIQNDFFKNYQATIAAFIAANPDKLKRSQFSVHYKAGQANILFLIECGSAQLSLAIPYSQENIAFLMRQAQQQSQLPDDFQNLAITEFPSER